MLELFVRFCCPDCDQVLAGLGFLVGQGDGYLMCHHFC